MPSVPSKTLEIVPNPHPDRDYEVTMTVPEFTCLCPKTGQPGSSHGDRIVLEAGHAQRVGQLVLGRERLPVVGAEVTSSQLRCASELKQA